jgi:hypothetical protein
MLEKRMGSKPSGLFVAMNAGKIAENPTCYSLKIAECN